MGTSCRLLNSLSQISVKFHMLDKKTHIFSRLFKYQSVVLVFDTEGVVPLPGEDKKKQTQLPVLSQMKLSKCRTEKDVGFNVVDNFLNTPH